MSLTLLLLLALLMPWTINAQQSNRSVLDADCDPISTLPWEETWSLNDWPYSNTQSGNYNLFSEYETCMVAPTMTSSNGTLTPRLWYNGENYNRHLSFREVSGATNTFILPPFQEPIGFLTVTLVARVTTMKNKTLVVGYVDDSNTAHELKTITVTNTAKTFQVDLDVADAPTTYNENYRLALFFHDQGTSASCDVLSISVDFHHITKIGSAEQWNTFATQVNSGYDYAGKTVELTADIEGATAKVGDVNGDNEATYSFSGNFDGKGHTLNVAITEDGKQGLAPFRAIKNANISNLKVTGTVTSNTAIPYTSGLVGFTQPGGNNTIENCLVQTVVTNNATGSNTQVGGIIGNARSATTHIKGCLFEGTLSSSSYEGGFVGWATAGANVEFINCQFKGANSGNGNFHPIGCKADETVTATVTNTYYNIKDMLDDDAHSIVRGFENTGKRAYTITGVDAVTVELTGSQETTYTVSDIHTYGTGIKHNGIIYAGQNDAVSINLAGASGYKTDNGTLAGTSNPYTFHMAGSNAAISSADPIAKKYHIGNESNSTTMTWSEFCDAVNNGTSYYKETIHLDEDITADRKAGTSDKSFSGIFDGHGHTITFNYTTAEEYAAPFAFVEGATFNNLKITGTINTSAKYAAGFVAHVNTFEPYFISFYSPCEFHNCVSDITINSTVVGDGTHGGFVAVTYRPGDNPFYGCSFTGKLLGPNTTSCGGFVGWAESNSSYNANAQFHNCVFNPQEVTISADNSATFNRGNFNYCGNSYYFTTFGSVQGKKAYTITSASDVTVENAGSVETFPLSGITSYGTGIKYNNTLYAGQNDNVSLKLVCTTQGFHTYNTTYGTITDNGGAIKTLNMPNLGVIPEGTPGVVISATSSVPENEYRISVAGDVTACSGLFTDSGGPAIEESFEGWCHVNETFTKTFYPCEPGTQCVVMNFTLFNTSGTLQIYDGTSTSSPLIGSYSDNSPGVVKATNSDGALTFHWDSHNVLIAGEGWEASISCQDLTFNIATSVYPPSAAIGSATVAGSCTINTDVTLTATPAESFAFVNWTENGQTVSTDNPYVFSAQSNRNLVANFAKAGPITITAENTWTEDFDWEMYGNDPARKLDLYPDNNWYVPNYITVGGSFTTSPRIWGDKKLSMKGNNSDEQTVVLPAFTNAIKDLAVHFDAQVESDYVNPYIAIGYYDMGDHSFHELNRVTIGYNSASFSEYGYVFSDGPEYNENYRIALLLHNVSTTSVNVDNVVVSLRPAVTKTFVTNGNWNVDSNWNPSGTPLPDDNVVINANATIANGTVAEVNTITIGDNGSITIEEGGQLRHNNTGVEATLNKNITKYTSEKDNYYFMSLPFVSYDMAHSALFVSSQTGFNYDFYAFDGTNDLEWIYRPSALTAGQGFLYANNTGGEYSLEGVLMPSHEAVDEELNYDTETPLGTWNLVGNPFACNATPSITDFYVIDGEEVVASQLSTVAPLESIMVQATAADQSITFTRASSSKAAQAITMSLAQADTRDARLVDRAIVRFDESNGLEKFQLNPSHTKVFIPQDGKDYAVVRSDNEGELPVSFKAEHNGRYTFSIAADNVEVHYLHLIDNLTGEDVDLLANPSYSFDAKTTDYESRFKLVFSTSFDTGDDFAFVSDGNIIICDAISSDAGLQIIDMTGRVIWQGSATRSISTQMMSPGVYVLQMVCGNDTKTQKIVVR